MKFNSASEALRWYAKICTLGVSGSGAASVENDDENTMVPETVNSGHGDPMLWANLIHAKVDIENAFFGCFPDKRGKWIQKAMLCWAVDGYDEALKMLANSSYFHSQLGRRTHEVLLSEWIGEITDALTEIKYIRVEKRTARKVAFK